MKIVTSYTLRVTRGILTVLRSYGLTVLLLSVFLLFCFSALHAQTNDSLILDSVSIQKNELIVTPEIEEMVISRIKNDPIEYYAVRFGIKNKEQLENLQLGKPIPWYQIVNEKLYPVIAMSVDHLAEGESLSLRFSDRWLAPVMSDEEPLLFVGITGGGYEFWGPVPTAPGVVNPIKQILNYEHKDLIIGSIEATPLGFGIGIDFLIIRKENKDVFVEVYDKITGEYFKNEYGSDELMNLLKDRAAKEEEAQRRYYAQVADKSELILTPELTEMLCNRAFSHLDGFSDETLSSVGIKNRPKLENLHPGKPVPLYSIVNENLIFTGRWEVPVMSEGEPPFYTSTVKLEDNGQYSYAGGGTANYEVLNNYKYKDLLIGYLRTGHTSYVIIRKDNKDFFVKFDIETTGEVLNTEYSLSDIINLLKK